MQHKSAENTTLQALGDSYFQLLKGYSLTEWLADQRDLGHSYRRIAERLAEATDGAIVVTYRTISRWVDDLPRDRVAS